jgi:hypothetical protein
MFVSDYFDQHPIISQSSYKLAPRGQREGVCL